MPISKILLLPRQLNLEARDYLRAMAGREIQARVLRGGPEQGTALLRLGNLKLQARIEGARLTTDQTLFLRVERAGTNGFLLRILGGPAVRGGEGFDLPLAVIQSFARFMERSPRLLRNQALKPESREKKSGESSAARLNSLRALLPPEDEIEGFLLESFREDGRDSAGGGRQADRRPGETASPEGPKSESESDPGNPGSGHQGDEENQPASSALGWGRLSSRPYYYFLRIQPVRLGEVGILIDSGNAEFSEISVYLTCRERKTERLLSGRIPSLKRELEKLDIMVGELQLLKPADWERRGVDFRV